LGFPFFVSKNGKTKKTDNLYFFKFSVKILDSNFLRGRKNEKIY